MVILKAGAPDTAQRKQQGATSIRVSHCDMIPVIGVLSKKYQISYIDNIEKETC